MARRKTSETSETNNATAAILLDTAERLFASQGIDNVSIRQIVMTSGHGNLSGAHYHFGTREALIRALLARRMEVVDAIRHEALDKLVAEGRDLELASIIGSTVGVVETVIRSFPWGKDYVHVMAQALFNNARVQLLTTIEGKSVSGLARTSAMARGLCPHLTEAEFEDRMRMVRYHVIFEVSRWLHENTLDEQSQGQFKVMIERATRFVVGGLAAPPQ